MKIYFVASEAVPFVKTGGLGDVSGTLPLHLRKIGLEVNLILPLYKQIQEANYSLEKLFSSEIIFGDHLLPYSVYRQENTFFIKQDDLYNRREIYNTPSGDYPDNNLRFAFFSLEALELINQLGGADIIHVHDWQTALLPVYKSIYYPNNPEKVILTIHNLAYQGIFTAETVPMINIPPNYYSLESLEFYGKVNYLKGGIIYSDYLTTVSPTYAQEIQTEPYGFALEGVITKRRKNLRGIINGIDYDYWNPETDPHITINYGEDSVFQKKENKKHLLAELKTGCSIEYPLLAFVGRLVSQKGIDIIIEIADQLPNLPANLIILGKGEKKYEEEIKARALRHPNNIIAITTFDEVLSRKIYASSDFFLMPSQFEPCGLGQLIALKYGSVPIVRKTGGLKDTIQDYHDKTACGNGITFENQDAEELMDSIKRALLYFPGESYINMQNIGMKGDFSWNSSAREYSSLYRQLTKNKE
ncbi:MAG: Glycogen synthase [candidate division WS2 bacterium]|uniref:Glycogen synthase n=1 Tax=Psychracetigena formicireducens TaxID=2986056 RepID=A0A9E2BFR2_PSYF1|nr:Glycogen synthase [Candidatus Psychracetigena formicireducens]MBT9144781.1 Glycogen synthase [Candidatus Psychracetigena formicireducens]